MSVSVNSSHNQRHLRSISRRGVEDEGLHDWTNRPVNVTGALGEFERFDKEINDDFC